MKTLREYTHTHTCNLKKEKGLTLVVLVITIIILLILAAVTIGQLTGNGIFEKVQLAKERWDEAEKKEIASLEEYENYINNTEKGVSTQKGKWELLASTTNKTDTEFEVKDLKQFSSFILICYCNENNALVATTYVNYDLLIGQYEIFANYNNGESFVAKCRYVDDTTIKLQCCTNKTLKAELYGIY